MRVPDPARRQRVETENLENHKNALVNTGNFGGVVAQVDALKASLAQPILWGNVLLMAASACDMAAAAARNAARLCDYEFARTHIYETAVVETSNSGGENSNTESSDGDPAIGDAMAGLVADQRAEFQNIIDVLNAANAAIRSRGEKALFCLPALSPVQEVALYDT